MSSAPVDHAKYMYIDCVRGYAILMVIACHTTAHYPELPGLVMKQTKVGWHGVQLFFLASCVTLMMSWAKDVSRGGRDIGAFFLRRFLRIAPAYYLAALAYYFLQPPPAFDAFQLGLSLSFLNGWTPETIPTVAGHWEVVPGGWSVAAEMCFYLLLPAIATVMTTLRRSVIFVVVSIGVSCVANSIFLHFWRDAYPPLGVSNFLYFWLPNQLPVFALGTVLYHLIPGQDGTPTHPIVERLCRHGNLLAGVCVLLFMPLAQLKFAQYWMETPYYLPTLFLASLTFVGFILGMSTARRGLFVNRWVAAMGEVSFSCYLVHWAVLRFLFENFPTTLGTSLKRYASMPAYAFGYAVTVLITFAIASITYRLVERPMIGLAKRLTANRKAATQPRTPEPQLVAPS